MGLANLAWGVFALLTVIFDWGLVTMSASFLISRLHFGFVAIFVTITPDARQRTIGPIIGISVWALMMILMGSFGLAFAIGS